MGVVQPDFDQNDEDLQDDDQGDKDIQDVYDDMIILGSILVIMICMIHNQYSFPLKTCN